MDNMTDKELLSDLISSQKLIDSSYNTYSNECANPSLRNAFLNILREEHDIQAELFSEAQLRGWYQVKQAEQNQIIQTKQRFANAI